VKPDAVMTKRYWLVLAGGVPVKETLLAGAS